MVKTIAVGESTWEVLKRLMRAEGASSLDETIRKLIQKAERVPESGLGMYRKIGRRVLLSQKEHEEITRSSH